MAGATVSSDAVAEWEPLLYRLARYYEARNGAEKDDLVQEGRIAVWLTLERGLSPNETYIRQRMMAWVKYLGSQLPTDYESMLPLYVADIEVYE